MYVWIWHKLPGGTALKALASAILLLLVAAVLFFVVFPAVEPHLPFDNTTVTSQ